MVSLFSNVFTDMAVLDAAAARVWGDASPGAAVSVVLDGVLVANATAAVDGTWRALLPPVAASSSEHTLSAASGASAQQTLHRVLFGRVFVCSGQSNVRATADIPWGADAL
jgi:hypothetical protein